MLGRYGEGAAEAELLDRRKIAAVAATILSIGLALLGRHALGWDATLCAALEATGLALLGVPIVIAAAQGLAKGHTNVDELVALALIASAIGGYWLEASVVALLMVLGSLFEQRASMRARRAIEQLLRLTPDEATVVDDQGRETTLPATQLRAGMRVRVRAGQRVPADGTIESGGSNFDESAVTGESVPVWRDVGRDVFAATLTVDGSATLRVTRAGADSTVGQIVRIVQDAEGHQAPIMRVVDRWARWYTPAILALAALAWGASWWMGADKTWERAVAVLIVGCPCALVLATPTAIIAAMGRSAKLGALIKSGTALERAADVDTLVFDKTGTLTTGKHRVVAVVPAGDFRRLQRVAGLCPAVVHSIVALHGDAATEPSDPGDREAARRRLLALAASVEHHSNHPFARTICAYAKARGVEAPPADAAREIPGVGVQGRVDGQPVMVARPEHVARSVRNACAVPGTLIRPIQRYSVVAVEVAGRYAGLILLRDTLRPASLSVVRRLREAGLVNLAVLSGDHRGAVKLVADELRLDHAFGALMPAEKSQQVRAMREQGRVVAFVGDGINDAPALATADVGIAMGGSGADIALQTADVVLLNDRLELLATLFELSRATQRTIKRNLVLGLAISVGALALASLGVISPMVGAVVHNLGSAFVVGNSARLAGFGQVRRTTPEAQDDDTTLAARQRQAA